MQEFSSISVSTYDPDALVGQLNDRASDGWDVVSIVPTGSTITAYLSRESSGETTSSSDTAAVIPEPAAEPTAAPEPAPVEEPAGEPGLPDAGAVAAAAAAAAATQHEPAAE
ncbi:MAG: hypothetical protein CL424_06545, partial [Acidimicrobiaceae bacterium]|nr:hypothetical protein [Acidimicrobiaceae bacterium]